jgi:hypothetical protein
VACLGFRVFGVDWSPSCAGAFFIVRSRQAVTVKGRFGRALQSWHSAPVRLDGTAGTKWWVLCGSGVRDRNGRPRYDGRAEHAGSYPTFPYADGESRTFNALLVGQTVGWFPGYWCACPRVPVRTARNVWQSGSGDAGLSVTVYARFGLSAI